jgi:hypothetical protein
MVTGRFDQYRLVELHLQLLLLLAKEHYRPLVLLLLLLLESL